MERIEQHQTGGRAVGGWVICFHRSFTTVICECCSCEIQPGRQLVEVEIYGECFTVCIDCAGER